MAGICVLGMGDCAPDIKNIVTNVSNVLNENIHQTMMNLTSNTSVFKQASQSFEMGDIVGNGCSVKFDPISQNMQVSTNFSQMTKVITEEKYNANMATAIDNAVKSNTEATTGFMSSGSNVTNETTNYHNNISKVLKSFNFNSFQSLMQKMDASQKIRYGNLHFSCTPETKIDPACGAQICMGGQTQHMVLTMIASQITDTMSKTIEDIIQTAQTKSKAESTTTVKATGMLQDLGTALSGIISSAGYAIGMMFSVPLMIGLGMIILLVVAVIAIKYAMGSSDDQGATSSVMMASGPGALSFDPNAQLPMEGDIQQQGDEMSQPVQEGETSQPSSASVGEMQQNDKQVQTP
jgi:hypothetical protein